MAGIGFELKKMINTDNGYLKAFGGYMVSAVIMEGPMLFNILLMYATGFIMRCFGANFGQVELYLILSAYIMVFSLVLSGFVTMFLSRLISNYIYKHQTGRIILSFYKSMTFLFVVSILISTVFSYYTKISQVIILINILRFGFMSVLWIMITYLSAIKKYAVIFAGFFCGVMCGLIFAAIMMYEGTTPIVAGCMASLMAIILMAVIFLKIIINTYPSCKKEDIRMPKYVIEGKETRRCYMELAFIGFFVAAGLFAHNIVYWFSDNSVTMAGNIRYCMKYDVPAFVASVTILPFLIQFVIMVETRFHTEYKKFFNLVLNTGTQKEIHDERKKMGRLLFRELFYICQLQFIVTIFAVSFAGNLLSKSGFDRDMIIIFRYMCFGYYFYVIFKSAIIILLYLDDRKRALVLSGITLILQVVFSLFLKGQSMEYYGLSFLGASLAGAIMGLLMVYNYIKQLEYNVFLKQPIGKGFLNIIFMCISMSILTGCGLNSAAEQKNSSVKNESTIDKDITTIDDISCIDNMEIYAKDDLDSVIKFYVTVRYGNEEEGTNHSLVEVNNAIRFADSSHVDTNVLASALVRITDENGNSEGKLGHMETESNATIRIRGNSSSTMPVKSYKLKLSEGAGLWRGQSNLALNKHAFDVTKFRNKLYMDILKEIDAIPSLRTQFALLYLKDETSGKDSFENYGLYTQVEVPTKKYLSNHGMDPAGYLYKAISFNFEPNEAIKNFDDPLFDEAAMDSVISCRGREDNTKLIELIEMVNDETVDINYVVDNFFDRDNLEYYMAYNILMGNLDVVMQNYYLYSPLNGNKWYFIPWDGDACLYRKQWEMNEEDKYYDDWECGISNYWGISLYKRYLKIDTNRESLDEKVEELHSWLNKEYIDKKAMEYNSVVEKYVTNMPDILYLSYTVEERNKIVNGLGDEVENNYRLYKQSLNALMPFYMYEPEMSNEELTFSWEEAYDFGQSDIYYSIVIAKDPELKQQIFAKDGIRSRSVSVPLRLLEKNDYIYYAVKAYSSDGRACNAMNKILQGDIFYTGEEKYNFVKN